MRAIALLFCLSLCAHAQSDLGSLHRTTVDVARRMSETDQLASASWNLPKIEKQYAAELKDARGWSVQVQGRGGAPDMNGAEWADFRELQRLGRELQCKVELLTLQMVGEGPRDPHGLRNLAARLKDRYDFAVQLRESGNPTAAEQEFQRGVESWEAVQHLHPNWRPHWVQEQQSACTAGERSVIQAAVDQEARYRDPVFGGVLEAPTFSPDARQGADALAH